MEIDFGVRVQCFGIGENNKSNIIAFLVEDTSDGDSVAAVVSFTGNNDNILIILF